MRLAPPQPASHQAESGLFVVWAAEALALLDALGCRDCWPDRPEKSRQVAGTSERDDQ